MKVASKVEAVTYTNSDGYYEFKGVVTDNYIIRFTYGSNINGGSSTINSNAINARNYKSTIITENNVKEAMNGSTDKWHLSMDQNANNSIAVDDLQNNDIIEAIPSEIKVDDIHSRLDITSLKNGNFGDGWNVEAYSQPFKIQVEYNTTNQNQKVKEDGEPDNSADFENESKVFDFGIIERARENIVIDKTISNLKITLANGQVLIDGDPYNEKLDYVKALGSTIKYREDKVRNKLLSIEIDPEIIHGAKIDITYAITVTNNSEHDYDYYVDDELKTEYYYYGTNNADAPLTTTTIEQIVDYVDDEVTVTTDGENENWEIKDWKYLLDNGYIDPTLNPDGTDSNRILNKNYWILTTDFFRNLTTDRTNNANSDTVYLHVSKLLGNQENEYTYENHVEIIEIGGKIARTIDSVSADGEQIGKLYEPGNYKPTTGDRVHQQDDDRIIATITPPTGLFDNIITYIIIIAVSLVVIGTGTFIIKKKVLGK